MRARFVYSRVSGRGLSPKKIEYIVNELKKTFDEVEVCTIETIEEGREFAKSSLPEDTLIISGGDGFFNRIISEVARMDNPPTIGYINSGTLCDIGVNFGVKGSIKNSLKIIEEGYTKEFDAVKINNHFFFYMSATGAFSSVSYKVRQKNKRKIGRFSYYFSSLIDFFKKYHIKGVVKYDDKEISFDSPFIMCLSGKNVGGFKVNDGKIDDGIVELYLPRHGLFHGIFPIIFKSKKVVILKSDKFDIVFDKKERLIKDGELFEAESVHIECLKKKLKIYAKR